jgi:hypothetical protein
MWRVPLVFPTEPSSLRKTPQMAIDSQLGIVTTHALLESIIVREKVEELRLQASATCFRSMHNARRE